MIFKFPRPAGRRYFPLIASFVHTGESMNPWRCEACATQKHHKAIVQAPEHLATAGIPQPECCRKCGIDFLH